MTTGLQDLSQEITELQKLSYRAGWRDAMIAFGHAIEEIRDMQTEFREPEKQDAES